MKTTSFILALVLSTSLAKAQNAPQVSYFPLQNVKLLDSPFLQAQQTDLHYILALDPDRLLAPFLREAGLQPKAPQLHQLGKYRIGRTYRRTLFIRTFHDVCRHRRYRSL